MARAMLGMLQSTIYVSLWPLPAFCLWPQTASRLKWGGFLFTFTLYFVPFALFVFFCYVQENGNVGGPDVQQYASVGIVVCLVWILILSTIYRYRIRTLASLNGNILFDFLIHCFCHVCGTIQEAQQVDYMETEKVTLRIGN